MVLVLRILIARWISNRIRITESYSHVATPVNVERGAPSSGFSPWRIPCGSKEGFSVGVAIHVFAGVIENPRSVS